VVSILDALRAGVKVADKVTKPLQPSVSFERYLSEDGFGTRTYASAVSLKAIVEHKQRNVSTMTGELAVSHAYVMFLDIAALVIATAGDGVDVNDKITLPNGVTGPILNFDGFVDAGTGQPLATEIYLG
jgi:hypothetical protein